MLLPIDSAFKLNLYFKCFKLNLYFKYLFKTLPLSYHKMDPCSKDNISNMTKEHTLIQKQAQLIQEQKNLIQEQKNQIKKQTNLISEYVSSTPDTSKIYNEDTLELESIDKERVFNYGTGQLRYKKGDIYYHGIGPIEDKFAWYRKSPFDRVIFEYRSNDHVLPHIEWDTHNAQEFCNHCECDIEATRKRRVINNYICLGHTIL